jgi:hypothetical protein
VSINAKGDLILRPTYFELSVVHRGASARHHLTGSYALSFAAVLRAQVRLLWVACSAVTAVCIASFFADTRTVNTNKQAVNVSIACLNNQTVGVIR